MSTPRSRETDLERVIREIILTAAQKFTGSIELNFNDGKVSRRIKMVRFRVLDEDPER